MSMFIRRFLVDPGDEVLLEIESVNILDLEPPTSITGVGSGTVLLVGEFENGTFNEPYELGSATDLVATFGSFGYTYAGTVANNPCARSRKADSAINPEYWNGNGFIALNGKKFRRLIVCRVDTSIGSIEFRRLAYITGASAFRYNLEPAQVLELTLDALPAASTTFNAAAATVTGAAGVFPTLFTGGETLVLGFDGEANFTTTFLAADQSNAQVAARINAFAGFTFADVSGGQIRLTGRQRGTGAQVRIVSGSAGVLTALGLTAATTAGTGNVVNIDATTVAEIKTLVEATHGAANVEVEQDLNGALRISNTATPLTGTITVGALTTATGLGFVAAQTSSAVSGNAGTIPAGTRIRNAGSTVTVVTMQDVAVTSSGAGPYSVKVRHAVDDGTGLVGNAGTVNVVMDVPDIGSFSALNPIQLTPALTEAQIDAAYQTALDATLDPNSVAAETNISWSARQSNTLRRAMRQNALDASANGLFGRLTCVRPPMGTTKVNAKSTTAEPGVGAYRNQRVVYTYPQVASQVPLIARVGIAGGNGFTANGVIDIGADGFLASIMSQLAPEENPGQLTTFTGAVLGLESSANAKNFGVDDYKAFKKSGICAPRMSKGILVFQSGVTSVDPVVNPNLVNIARRRMADFIQDSLAGRAIAYGKKTSTTAQRKALSGEVREFVRGLLSPENPTLQRIAGYTVDDRSANTPTQLGKGIYRILVAVKTLSSLDSIVISVTAGEQVVVEEELPQAA